MVYSAEVEVLSITQATDVLTGELVYQAGLGRIGKPAEGLPMAQQMRRVSSNTIIVFMPVDKECPYKAGSKWILGIDEDGALSLKKKG